MNNKANFTFHREHAKIIFLLSASVITAGIGFYPGFMSADSLDQYCMSRTSIYRDWHPPIMAWVWSIIAHIVPGPGGMLAFHLSLLWAALYMWWKSYKECRLAWLFCIIPFLPWIWNFVGVLWKDVGMAFSLLLLSSFILRPPSRFRAFFVFSVAVYAINVRHNAVFAVVPILGFLVFRWFAEMRLLKKLAFIITATTCPILLGYALSYGLLAAEKTKPSNALILDYLVYLSAKHNRSYIPGFNVSEIKICATGAVCSDIPKSQHRLTGQIYCLSQFETYRKPAPSVSVAWGEYSPIWRALVAAYPVDYLSFRLSVFRRFMGLSSDPPRNIWFSGVVENDLGITHPPNALAALPENCVKATVNMFPILFRPYFYFLLSIGLLAVSVFLNNTSTRFAARSLAVSSIMYMLGYVFIAPSFDFRFVYWSVVATSVAFILLIVKWPGLRPVSRMAQILD